MFDRHHLKGYDLLRGMRAAMSGERTLETELSDELIKQNRANDERHDVWGPKQLSVPYAALRAFSAMTAPASGANLVPQQMAEFAPMATEQLGLRRAGVTILEDLVGTVKIPGAESLVGDDAELPGETGTVSDAEQVFRADILSPVRVSTQMTVSQTLLTAAPNPSLQALAARILLARCDRTVERQLFVGAGGTDELQGIFTDSSIPTSDISAVNGLSLASLGSDVSNVGGLLGRFAYVMPRPILDFGLATPRLPEGKERQLITPLGNDAYAFDSAGVFQSDRLEQIPGAESPSELMLGLVAGYFGALVVGYHAPSLDLVFSPFGEFAAKGNVGIFAHQWVSRGLVTNECIVKAYIAPDAVSLD